MASASIAEMEGNTSLINLRSALLGTVASILAKTFLQYAAVLLAFISLKYINTGANLLIDNAAACHAFLVALSVAGMAWYKIKLASRNTSSLPITSNDITPPKSNTIYITTCIFIISGFLALFCLLYVLHPFHAWFSLFLALFLFNNILRSPYHKAVEWLGGVSSPVFNILHSSNYYQKAVEWLGGISSPVFNIFRQVFRPPQQDRSSPQASNDAPATAV